MINVHDKLVAVLLSRNSIAESLMVIHSFWEGLKTLSAAWMQSVPWTPSATLSIETIISCLRVSIKQMDRIEEINQIGLWDLLKQNWPREEHGDLSQIKAWHLFFTTYLFSLYLFRRSKFSLLFSYLMNSIRRAIRRAISKLCRHIYSLRTFADFSLIWFLNIAYSVN